MFFTVLEQYCNSLFKGKKSIYDFLEMSESSYTKYKHSGKLSLKHYKSVCLKIGMQWTDENDTITEFIINNWFEVKK